MEFFIVMMSVPLFLIVLLLFALFVLPHYPRREQAQGAPPAEKTPGADKGPANIAGWGLTLLMYAAFVVAMISEFKLHKEK